MGDRQEFLKRIAESPEDTTVRLVFADWLEEQPRQAVVCLHCRRGEFHHRCHRCHGVINYDREHHSGEDYDGTWVCDRSERCPKCDGSGTVEDTADPDLAEFIRLQCELASELVVPDESVLPHIQSLLRVGYSADSAELRKWTRFQKLQEREWLLRSTHPEWQSCVCPRCGNPPQYKRECLACSGSGDLCMPFGVGAHRRQLVFRRGFPDEVSCTLAEVVRADGSPTEWAKAVVSSLPVTKFRVTDRKPSVDNPSELPDDCTRSYEWWDQDWWGSTERTGTDWLPTSVVDEVTKLVEYKCEVGTNSHCEFRTQEAANTALSVALGQLARKSLLRSLP